MQEVEGLEEEEIIQILPAALGQRGRVMLEAQAEWTVVEILRAAVVVVPEPQEAIPLLLSAVLVERGYLFPSTEPLRFMLPEVGEATKEQEQPRQPLGDRELVATEREFREIYLPLMDLPLRVAVAVDQIALIRLVEVVVDLVLSS
jgi:hypothetical protein